MAEDVHPGAVGLVLEEQRQDPGVRLDRVEPGEVRRHLAAQQPVPVDHVAEVEQGGDGHRGGADPAPAGAEAGREPGDQDQIGVEAEPVLQHRPARHPVRADEVEQREHHGEEQEGPLAPQRSPEPLTPESQDEEDEDGQRQEPAQQLLRRAEAGERADLDEVAQHAPERPEGGNGAPPFHAEVPDRQETLGRERRDVRQVPPPVVAAQCRQPEDGDRQQRQPEGEDVREVAEPEQQVDPHHVAEIRRPLAVPPPEAEDEREQRQAQREVVEPELEQEVEDEREGQEGEPAAAAGAHRARQVPDLPPSSVSA